jgi:hypothetical protein
MVQSRAWLLTALIFVACGGDESVMFALDGGGGTSAAAGRGGGGSASTGGDGGQGGTGDDAAGDALGPADTGMPSDDADPDAAAGTGGGASDAGSDATGGSAGSDTEAGTDACPRPTVYYADEDRDRYGSPARFVSACSPPPGNWSLNATDCNDGDSRVHPNQAAYFGSPYPAASGASSFDYDCSGTEEEDPAQTKAPENCGVLAIAFCAGTGHTKTARVGPGLSSFCGSEELNICRAALAILICESVTEPAEEPFRCK